MQEFEPLRRDLHVQARHACEVPSRALQRLDQSDSQWIRTHFEYDWYCRAHRFCRQRRGSASGRNNHGHRMPQQIRRQCRQLTVLTFGPAKFDRDVASLDVAAFAKALAEGSYAACERSGRLGTKISDQGHPLLRARGERPSGHRNTNVLEEFPSCHGGDPGQEEFRSVVPSASDWKGSLVSALGQKPTFCATGGCRQSSMDRCREPTSTAGLTRSPRRRASAESAECRCPALGRS
jgi:hypothetical protein